VGFRESRNGPTVLASPNSGKLACSCGTESRVRPDRLGHVSSQSFNVASCAGVDLKVQQELLRHADIRTTIYTQAVPTALREANSKVVRLVLPAQLPDVNGPLEKSQIITYEGDVGRGGGDRTTRTASLRC